MPATRRSYSKILQLFTLKLRVSALFRRNESQCSPHVAHCSHSSIESDENCKNVFWRAHHRFHFECSQWKKGRDSNRRSKNTKWQTYEESTPRREECPMLVTFTTNKVHHILNKEYRYAERAAIKMHLHRGIVVNIIIEKSVHFVAGSDASNEHRQERKKRKKRRRIFKMVSLTRVRQLSWIISPQLANLTSFRAIFNLIVWRSYRCLPLDRIANFTSLTRRGHLCVSRIVNNIYHHLMGTWLVYARIFFINNSMSEDRLVFSRSLRSVALPIFLLGFRMHLTCFTHENYSNLVNEW